MEEIKLDSEGTKKKFSKKNIWMIIVVAVIVSVACFFIIDSLLSIESKPDLEISGTSLSVEYTELLGYSAKVVGIAKNPISKNYSYASVEFSIYDSAGNNLGTAIANINNLSSGDTWHFEATLFSFPSTRPASFKLVDITVW